jgi:hypothetical protein
MLGWLTLAVQAPAPQDVKLMECGPPTNHTVEYKLYGWPAHGPKVTLFR